eukprot:2557092-Prymnesium_polylepis.1
MFRSTVDRQRQRRQRTAVVWWPTTLGLRGDAVDGGVVHLGQLGESAQGLLERAQEGAGGLGE